MEPNTNPPPYPFIVYQLQAMRTAASLESVEEDLLHAALGICDEAGEIAKAFKGSLAYKKELNVENLVEELGDILWFVALMADRLKIPMDYIAVKNIEKLYLRYPEKFTEEDAIARADTVQ